MGPIIIWLISADFRLALARRDGILAGEWVNRITEETVHNQFWTPS